MFLRSINIVDVNICVQEPDKFIANSIASTDLSEVMPYLNSMFRRSDYNPNSNSIKFFQDKIEFTLVKNQVNVARFCNKTELHELLDWLIDLVNDTYESMSEIVPLYTTRKRVPTLTIFNMLPKTNCTKCGEKSCMAFAAKLNKLEVDIDDCPPLLEFAFKDAKSKLENAFS